MDLLQAYEIEKEKLLNKLDESLKTQVKNAVTMSPVDTGRLRSGWKISRESKTVWRITNETPYTLFQEYGTSRQKGREMLGLRSGRFAREVIGRIK